MTTDQLDADLDRLRAAHFQIPDPDHDHVQDARRRVLATAPASTRARAPRSRTRRSRWTFAGAAGGLAVVAVVAVAVLPNGATDTLDRVAPVGLAAAQAAADRACAGPTRRAASTDRCLQALSVVAGDWNPPGTGKVLYQRSWHSSSIRFFDAAGKSTAGPKGPGVWGVARGAYLDSWVTPDGAGRTQQLGEGAAFLPSAADRAGWRAAGSPPLDGLRPNQRATGQELEAGAPDGRRDWPAGQAGSHLLNIGETNGLIDPANPLRGLSTDPATLYDQLRDLAWRQRIEIAGEPTCARDLSDCQAPVRKNIESAFGSIAVGFLTYPSTPRDLRESLLRMLASRPGHRTIGTTTHPDRRTGAAVLLPPGTNDGQDVLVIDTDTARPIGVGMSNDRTLRTTRWIRLLDLDTARVDAVGTRPDTP